MVFKKQSFISTSNKIRSIYLRYNLFNNLPNGRSGINHLHNRSLGCSPSTLLNKKIIFDPLQRTVEINLK